MIRLVERQLETTVVKPRTGFIVMVVFIVAFVVANVTLNAVDMLSSGWQLLISAAMLAGGAVWAFRRAAKTNGMSVGEYLCQMFYQSGKSGW